MNARYDPIALILSTYRRGHAKRLESETLKEPDRGGCGGEAQGSFQSRFMSSVTVCITHHHPEQMAVLFFWGGGGYLRSHLMKQIWHSRR